MTGVAWDSIHAVHTLEQRRLLQNVFGSDSDGEEAEYAAASVPPGLQLVRNFLCEVEQAQLLSLLQQEYVRETNQAMRFWGTADPPAWFTTLSNKVCEYIIVRTVKGEEII